MRLARLLYYSSRLAHRPADLDEILGASRLNNMRDDITGALISSDRFFVQLLEGDRVAVRQCFKRIVKDPRHRDVHIVSALPVDRRLFETWLMRGIKVSEIRTDIFNRYLIDGIFNPPQTPDFVLEHLCLTLSTDTWRAIKPPRDSLSRIRLC